MAMQSEPYLERGKNMTVDLVKMGQAAKKAAYELGQLSTDEKNQALLKMAEALQDRAAEIMEANALDLDQAKKADLKASFVDRLVLDEGRIEGMAAGLRQIAGLEDPIGRVDRAWVNYAGLEISQRRVPLGVIGIIYEARPNVTVDATGLCFKAGNAVMLRGGKEALRTNIKLVEILRSVLTELGINPDAVQILTETSHELANEFMALTGYLDVLIPRGSARLIKAVVANAKVPVIETGAGNCHIYVDAAADLEMAAAIVYNAKVQRPSVCNATEKLLVHQDVAAEFLPLLAAKLAQASVELRGDEQACQILGSSCKAATAADWDTEYNDYILAIKVVSSLDQAIDHINAHNTKHSEAIITNDYNNSQAFLDRIDAAAVYVNASTRFTDGGEFGFGAEIGISTQKLHARGPMGLRELTSTKYVIRGTGQVRK